MAPPILPSPLHWFKWEAYTTWISGFGLLVVLYYANANTYLVDRGVANINPLVAVAISLGLLAVGWLIYDALSRRLEGHDRLLAAALGVVIGIIPVSAALGVLVLAFAIAPRNGTSTGGANVSFSQIQAVIARRCQPCHSAQPIQPGFPQAPNGVMFDTPDQIVGRAQQIYQQAVATRNMPFGNLTNITQDERDLLAVWVQAGAPGP